MASINLIDSFQDFKEAEAIDRPTLMKVLEDVFKTLLRKKYGSDENFDVIVNDQTGDLEIFRRREVVNDGELEDELARKDDIIAERDERIGDLREEIGMLKGMIKMMERAQNVHSNGIPKDEK